VTVVARSTSRHGGRLDCGHRCQPGDPIVKVDLGDRGHQTSGHNGRGSWLCVVCAADVEDD
jgi:hypothetical protein